MAMYAECSIQCWANCCSWLHCHQVHKLETVLNWHLQHGALQDASVLQLLVVQAAADGNTVVLNLLLPLFEKMGWLVSYAYIVPALHGP